MNIKEEYDKLGKKYDLPSYEELDDEFELLYFQNILEIKYPLRFVRRRIVDKVSGFVNFFQGVISPTPGNLISMEESGFLSKEDKDEVVKMIKIMVVMERESLLLDINHDEMSDAEFIKKGYSKWKNLKLKVEEYAKKMKDGWNSEIPEEENEGHYFG